MSIEPVDRLAIAECAVDCVKQCAPAAHALERNFLPQTHRVLRQVREQNITLIGQRRQFFGKDHRPAKHCELSVHL